MEIRRKWRKKAIKRSSIFIWIFSSKIKEERQSRSHSSRRNYLTNTSALKVDNISRECGMCCTRQSRYTGPTRQLPCPMVYRPSRLTGMHVNEPRLFEGGWVTFCPFCMQNGALRVKRRRVLPPTDPWKNNNLTRKFNYIYINTSRIKIVILHGIEVN